MFAPVVADQGGGDRQAGSFDALVTHLRQNHGIAFAVEDSLDDGDSAHSGDVTDHVVEL